MKITGEFADFTDVINLILKKRYGVELKDEDCNKVNMDGYKGKIYAEAPPDPAKYFRPVYLSSSFCPICGNEMDGTEHGRQYCQDCKEKLKGEKNGD